MTYTGTLAVERVQLVEWRCGRCSKLLLLYAPVPGLRIEQTCPRCGMMNVLQVPCVA